MADYYLHKTAAHIDELLEKVEGLNNYDDTEVRGLINNKVDKVTGKGLSTNDFTDAYKTELDGLDTALNGKVDKESGKGLSTNDYTTSEKTKLNGIESGANVNVQADWNQTTTTADDYIKNKPAIPDAQIQSDWNQTNTESKDFIKNKPTIPAAQISSDWEASSGVAQILNKPTLGSAAAKNYTLSVTSDSNDLVTSDAVYSAVSMKADLENGKVPAAQLPSYVDDVLEYASTSAFPETGESGKIYISTDTNKTYRWSGTGYAEISESLALGETASTAYAGNKGKANADAIAAIKDGTNIDSFADVETALAAKLNTADVDDALSGTSTNPVQNKKVQAPLAMLIDNGAKNLFNQSESYGLDNISNDNGVYTTSGDTITTLRFQITKYLNGSRVEDLVTQSITSIGAYYWEFTKYSSFDSFMIGHNGSTYNGRFRYDLGKLKNGRKYVIRIDITRCSDSNGSFQWRDIMICTAEDYEASPVYQPYALPNTTITPALIKQVDEGAKNLLNLDTGEINPSVTTHDVTWTKDTLTGAVVANGTSDNSGSYPTISAITLKPGTYFMRGGTQRIKLVEGSGSATDSGNGASFTVTNNTVQPIRILVVANANTTFNNEAIYPMVCSSEDYTVSPTFQSYAPTNRELYNDINVLNQRIESFVYNLNTSKSIILTRASSATFLALGYVQGIGNIYWILEIDGSGNLTVKNGFDGSTVSAAGISFNKDTKTLTFTSSYNGSSNITIIMTSV